MQNSATPSASDRAGYHGAFFLLSSHRKNINGYKGGLFCPLCFFYARVGFYSYKCFGRQGRGISGATRAVFYLVSYLRLLYAQLFALYALLFFCYRRLWIRTPLFCNNYPFWIFIVLKKPAKQGSVKIRECRKMANSDLFLIFENSPSNKKSVCG